jgi:hypothetical protein
LSAGANGTKLLGFGALTCDTPPEWAADRWFADRYVNDPHFHQMVCDSRVSDTALEKLGEKYDARVLQQRTRMNPQDPAR